ncbi:hypothetical protein ACFWU5_24705 [Nocardia sp. NPDC058640]|uniref:hypothetical protein n=1 Tax=Nocardia sp. NPDC058640 TaxID=3346571 RepID=UPI003648C84F
MTPVDPSTISVDDATRLEVDPLIRRRKISLFRRAVRNVKYENEVSRYGVDVSKIPRHRQDREEHFDDLAAQAELDDELAGGDSNQARVSRFQKLFEHTRRIRAAPNQLTEDIGLKVAERDLEQQIRDAGNKPGDGILVTGRRGGDTLDIVAIVNGKLVVVEAKGGESKWPKLGTRLVKDEHGKWHIVRQGSRMYLRDLLRVDEELRYQLTLHKMTFGHLSDELHILDQLQSGSADITYSVVQARVQRGLKIKRGLPQRGPDRLTVTGYRFDIGEAGIGPLEPMTGGDPRPDKATRDAMRAQVKREQIAWPGKTSRAPRGRAAGVVGAAAVVAAGVSVASAGNASGESASPGLEAYSGMNLSGSVRTSTDDGVLSGLKATIAEFSRMATSFTSYVQNGLNDLAVMVGGAVAAASGFVTDVIDSAGAQAIIDKVSDDWAFAQELLNIAMLFSPVGTVAAAISAAVPIVQLIVEHWDEVRAAFDWVLKNVLTPVAEFFMTAFKVYVTPYRLAFDAVMAGFNGMGGVVGGAVGAVRSTVAGIVKAIGEIFQRLEINIGFPVNKSFGLRSVGDAMVAWASERLADGGLVGGQGRPAPRRGSGIEVMAVIDRSVLRAAQAEERKIGYAYRPPFLHDGALPRTDNGPGPRTFDVRVADVDAAFAQIRMLQAVQDARFSPVGV